MLVPILWTILWVILSTPVIWPWFWKKVIRNKELEFTSKRNIMFLSVAMGVIVAGGCIISYFEENSRYTLYGSFGIILIVLGFQLFHLVATNALVKIPNKGRKLSFIVILGIICFAMYGIDANMLDINDVNGINFDEDTVIEVSVGEKNKVYTTVQFSSPVINSQFALTNEPEAYLNRRFIYQYESTCKIIIFEQEASEPVRVIDCNYQFEISREIRKRYPFDRIEKIDVVVMEGDIPFAKYATFSKNRVIGGYSLDKFVLQNMLTGEITEYTVDTLPEFAK